MSKLGSNNEIDSLDAFFSDKLKDAEMQPSDKVWQQIEGSLNQDKKRRRGFIWLLFCGLFFIGAGIATYFVIANKNEVSNTKIATKETAKENTSAAETKKQTTTFASAEEPASKTNETENKLTENTTTETIAKDEAPNLVRIQLGAFKKQIDKSTFDKTGLNVKTETNEAGITRYYAEVPESQAKQTIEQLKQNGFADVFIKRNTLLAAKNEVVKSTDNETAASIKNVAAAKNSASKTSTTIVKGSENTLDVVKPVVNNSKQNTRNTSYVEATKNTNTDAVAVNRANELKKTNNTTPPDNTKNNEQKNNAGKTDEPVTTNLVAANTNTNQPEETKTEPVAEKQNEVAAPIDSVTKKDETPVTEVAKTDSVKSEPAKKDSAEVKTDDTPKPELGSRWAFLLTGGSNFFIRNTQNSLFDTHSETQPITYNGGVKAEYRLVKNIALSLGLTYNYFTAKQDATIFYFDKNQTSDFIFYSSYGPMPVSMSVMMQDFNPAPWINTLKASYSYTSKLTTLQIPLEAKWYFLNNQRINLFTSLGASAQFVLAEQTNLSIIKEHLTNYLTYNQVNTNKFNATLLFGLGGDIRLYKKLYFTVDGGFRYGASNISNTQGIKTNLTYISANGGVKIKL